MPSAMLKKLNETVDIPMSELEALWQRAKDAAERYEGSNSFYPVAMRIFKNMLGAHFPKQYKEYQKLKSESTADKASIVLHLEGDCIERFVEFLKMAETITHAGSGVTLTYETNDGDKGSLYFDGDGRDRVSVELI